MKRKKSSQTPLSSVIKVSSLSKSSLNDAFESLNTYIEKFSRRKKKNLHEADSLMRVIKMMMIKSAIAGDREMFNKFKGLEKNFEKISKKIAKK